MRQAGNNYNHIARWNVWTKKLTDVHMFLADERFKMYLRAYINSITFPHASLIYANNVHLKWHTTCFSSCIICSLYQTDINGSIAQT